MIVLNNVCKRFGDHTVIQDLSYTFPQTGIVALMGASGIGKTTLLRLLCGLEHPESGSIRSQHRKLAASFQEPRLIPWLNCRDNIKFVLSRNNLEHLLISDILSALDLEGCENLFPHELSGGMKQRVSLARALAVGADLLLLDEPFSALDAQTKQRLYPLIQRANPNGLTLMITHNKEEALALGAQILLLESVPVSALSPIQ
jgi:NitT/TauT family transport system ATP-binding protein